MKLFLIGLLFFLSASSASSQWTLINQTDTKEDTCFICGFRAVKFFGADTGIAFGAKDRKGESIKWLTYDGGRSWNETIMSSPGHAWVDAITDIDHYWWSSSKSDSGLRTSDGGSTYKALSPYEFYGFASLYFVDSLLGFTGAEKMEMYRTTDGGTSWLKVHDSATYSGYKMRWISFNNPAIGIALTEEIATWVLRTVDSGKTWISPTTPNYPAYSGRTRSFTWPTPTAAYLISSRSLILSADTGLTWRHVGVDFPSMFARDGAFFDSLNGIVVGYPLPYDSSETTVVALTSDGGASWRRMVLDSVGTLTSAYYPSRNTAYVKVQTKLYRLDIDQLAVDDKPSARVECFGSEIFDHSVNFRFTEPTTGQVRVADVMGRSLRSVVIQAQTRLTLAIDDLPNILLISVPCGEAYRVLKIRH